MKALIFWGTENNHFFPFLQLEIGERWDLKIFFNLILHNTFPIVSVTQRILLTIPIPVTPFKKMQFCNYKGYIKLFMVMNEYLNIAYRSYQSNCESVVNLNYSLSINYFVKLKLGKSLYNSSAMQVVIDYKVFIIYENFIFYMIKESTQIMHE